MKKRYFVLLALIGAVLVCGLYLHNRYTFTTEKWVDDPQNRTRIVDDLLSKQELTGMTEEEVTALLGSPNNDFGYFVEPDRYVYWLGPERGLISIDSEWLLIDFADGAVEKYHICTD